jgi:hypothetical protein
VGFLRMVSHISLGLVAYLFDTCSGFVRCSSMKTRTKPEQIPNKTRTNPEGIPKQSRSNPEQGPKPRRTTVAWYQETYIYMNLKQINKLQKILQSA